MVLSVSAGWDQTRAILQAWERPSPDAPWAPVGAPIEASLGRTGLAWGRGLHPTGLPGPEKREGDGKSPAGVFDLRLVTGYAKTAPAGTRMPYRQATATLRCVDDPRSLRYNRLADEARSEEGLVVGRGHAAEGRSLPPRRLGGPQRRAGRPRRGELHLPAPAPRPRLHDLGLHGLRARADGASSALARPRGAAGPRAAARRRVPRPSRRVGASRAPPARPRPRPRPRRLPARTAERDHGRRRRARRPGDPRRGRLGPHGRHRRPAPRGEPLPGEGAGGRLRRQRVREARGLDPGARARHDRDADRPHQHPRRRDGGRGRGGLDARPARQRGRAVGERGRGRDERRKPERHPLASCAAGARPRGDPVGDRRAGGRGLGRCGHRNGGLRLEGRHRDGVETPAGALRRTHARRPRPGELRRCPDDGRGPGRARAGTPCLRTGHGRCHRPRRPRGWLLHDRRGDRRTALGPRPGAPRRPGRSSASRARGRRSATAAATTRSPSPRRRICASGTARRPPANGRSSRRTPSRPSSRRPSRRPRRPS